MRANVSNEKCVWAQHVTYVAFYIHLAISFWIVAQTSFTYCNPPAYTLNR